jgi:hypothetical protein
LEDRPLGLNFLHLLSLPLSFSFAGARAFGAVPFRTPVTMGCGLRLAAGLVVFLQVSF